MDTISKEEAQEILKNQRAIIAANEQLAKENQELKGLLDPSLGGQARLLRRITERKVEVRMIDGKVVLGYKNKGSETRPLFVYERPDPRDPQQRVLWVDLILEGMKDGDAPLSVEYTAFRQESGRVVCKVLETKEKEWIMNQGTVKKKSVEEYAMVELDYEVPLDVTGFTRWFVVEVPKEFGGPRSVSVSEKYVNIA